MKIGILTLPFNNNYGGYLQAYALMTVLKEMGHDVELIYRKHNRRSLKRRIKYYIENTIKILLCQKHGSFIPDQEKELRQRGSLMMPFVDRYIVPRTKPLYSTKELRLQTENRYDFIIVGSDQIWRPDYVPNIENFFLTFLSDKTKRIAYAASFGTDMPIYTDRQKIICGNGIEKFDFVSVREEGALQVIRDFGWKCQKKPIQVLDPTMLLSKEHYKSLIKSEVSKMKGMIFCYILDPSEYTQELIGDVSTSLGLKPVEFLDSKQWKNSNFVLPSIESWLAAFRDAEFVITDSFHGTVFSIIFNKPFVTCINANRGADRFKSLLSQFGLMDNLFYQGKSYESIGVNWQQVNDLLVKRKADSIALLQTIPTCFEKY